MQIRGKNRNWFNFGVLGYFELFLREGNRQAFIDGMNFSDYPDHEKKIRALYVPSSFFGEKMIS